MEGALLSAAGALDGLRARALRATLAIPGLERIFKIRSRRLALLFGLSLALSLVLSLFQPLWVLLLGPVIYGYPHLLASVRYVGDRAASGGDARLRTGLVQAFLAVFVAVSAWRLAIDLGALRLPAWSRATNLPELVSLAASLTLVLAFSRASSRREGRSRLRGAAIGAAIAGPLLALSWTAPLATIGALLLIHNAVGFAYWISAARRNGDARVATAAALAFLAVTALILGGAFDGLYAWLEPGFQLGFARLDAFEIGRTVFPRAVSADTWMHATVAYAFGQSLHYFVWMKAIPDERHAAEAPTSFRQSLRLAQRDFGRRALLAAAGLVVVGLGLWGALAIPLARTVYFSVSAFHGYLELAGLASGGFEDRAGA